MASGNVAPWVGTSDITMMYSVTDIMGLNPFMRRVLANAAAAACGMAEVEVPTAKERPLVGITTVGITTVGAMTAAKVLEKAGYRYEGRLHRSAFKDGRTRDQLLYAYVIGEEAS